MAVVIRLKQMGARSKRFYRVIVTDSRWSRDGRFIEEVGHYDPRAEKEKAKFNLERVKYWLDNGAKPSETVKSHLKQADV